MKYRIFSFILIEEDDVKNFWTPDIIIDQARGVDNTMMMKMAMVMLNCTVHTGEGSKGANFDP